MMGGRVSDIVRAMVHRRRRRGRSRRGRWRVAEKTPVDRTGDLGSAWVRTGNSHRVSAISVPARSLRPNRRGDRKRGNHRDAVESILYLHPVAPIVDQFGKDAAGNYGCGLNRILLNLGKCASISVNALIESGEDIFVKIAPSLDICLSSPIPPTCARHRSTASGEGGALPQPQGPRPGQRRAALFSPS
jgi:hypothetical protein